MNREEKIARLRAAHNYWQKFGSGPGKFNYAYMHPPDLFNLDPATVKPCCVPANFIPERVGGTIAIVQRTEGRQQTLDAEGKEFILSNFLPGGYKKRWGFKHFRAIWQPSSCVQGASKIEQTFDCRKVVALNEIYSQETFSPLDLPTDQTSIYFPETVYVEEIEPHGIFYWDDTIHLLTQRRTEGTTHEAKRDPISSPLWETIPLSVLDTTGGSGDTNAVTFQQDSLLQSAAYIPDFRLARCYYANCLQLFTNGQSLTRLIPFYHDQDDQYALIGTEHISQAVIFSIDLRPHLEKVMTDVASQPVLQNDLRLAYLGTLLHSSVLQKEGLLGSLYDVDWFLNFLCGVDYVLKEMNPDHDLGAFFRKNLDEQKRIVSQLIPQESEIRLRLAGITPEHRVEIIEILEKHQRKLRGLIEEAFNETSFRGFIQQVLSQTIEKAIQVWSQQVFSIVGEGLTFWSDSMDNGQLHVYAYDTYQGGTGIAREFYAKIQTLVAEPADSINDQIRQAILCDVDVGDAIIRSIFKKYNTHFLSGVFLEDKDLQEQVVNNALDDLEKNRHISLDNKKRDDICTFVKLDLKRFTTSEDLIAFYRELVLGYDKVKSVLKRTPNSTDMLLYCSAHPFYDPRALRLFEVFRTRHKGDLTEISARVDEIMPVCINACPECIDLDNQYGITSARYEHRDKRVLLNLLDVI
ncbi:hypothetical protein E2N92_00715 [Methanofollis formosanus]|uniref:Uncharacterized protein n=1 Tax=Methanofollis formosanus TaxID=299308 RepID=A0A8G1A084_9EURY|nr:hypothetical protein [Methanofollis formosanus]QYZ78054.1 hypothetical protein E2N92_00715 [Methanofollis formosanus]